MAYEVDFISVRESEAKKDADAIVIRWKDGNNYKVAVYDGGFQAHGETMVKHLKKYYFPDSDNPTIDAVIVSHSDQDHTDGLKAILENFQVKVLYMNRPWLYVKALYGKITDRRATKESLIQTLKEEYKYIDDLDHIAQKHNIRIYPTFKGLTIENLFTVLSPSRDFYLDLIVESIKTSFAKSVEDGAVSNFSEQVKNLREEWDTETLREDVSTSAKNEMSIVLYGNMGEGGGVLLVGDAGLRALNNANDFAEENNISLKNDVKFMQIPHHGGRHNVSTTLLDNIIGKRVSQGTTIDKTAFVCAAENSDHPLQMVINAYIRRGVNVYAAKGNIIHHQVNMPVREGWTSLAKEEFNPMVEEWD